jgi:hypothetical protein
MHIAAFSQWVNLNSSNSVYAEIDARGSTALGVILKGLPPTSANTNPNKNWKLAYIDINTGEVYYG